MKILDVNDTKTQEFLQKIGRVIVEVNFVEMFVELLIWQLISTQKSETNIGRRITINLGFIEKADLLRSLVVERKGEDFAKEFTEDIYKNLQKVAERRDDIAHSLWYIQYGTNKDDLETEKINFVKAYERGKAFKFEKAKRIVSPDELDECIKIADKVVGQILNYGVNKL